MASYQIVISPQGETAGSPGESLTLDYSKIASATKRVDYALADASGVTSFEWRLVSQPVGASASIVNPTSSSCYIECTASISGTYLVECVINGGTDVAQAVGIAFTTQYAALRKPVAGESIQFSASHGWEEALSSVIDNVDLLNIPDEHPRQRKVINIVDCTVAPPAEINGYRYILDTTGTVNAAWDGAAQNDIVEFNSGTGLWEATTPEEGWVVYVDLENKDAIFVDDGTPQWELRIPAAGAFSEAQTIYVDVTNGTDDPSSGTAAQPYASITYACAQQANPANYTEFATPLVIRIAAGIYSENPVLPYRKDIYIHAHGTMIGGDITWGYDMQYWYGQSPFTAFSYLHIYGGLQVGTILSQNDSATNGSAYYRFLFLNNMQFCGVRNLASGGASSLVATGSLYLVLNTCLALGLSLSIGGQREPSYANSANPIILYATNSQFNCNFYADVDFAGISNCVFQSGTIDYSKSVTGGSGYAGYMGTTGAGFLGCYFFGGYSAKFGWDGSTGANPPETKMDLATYNASPSATFTSDNRGIWLSDRLELISQGTEPTLNIVDRLIWRDTSWSNRYYQVWKDISDVQHKVVLDRRRYHEKLSIIVPGSSTVYGYIELDRTEALVYYIKATQTGGASASVDFYLGTDNYSGGSPETLYSQTGWNPGGGAYTDNSVWGVLNLVSDDRLYYQVDNNWGTSTTIKIELWTTDVE